MLNIYIETYGCQMNESDSEIVASIMADAGYEITKNVDDSDVIFLNTCSVRDNAEKTIFNRLNHLKHYKKKNKKLIVGILGCMAERLRSKLAGHANLVSLVVGPDEYRALPELVEKAFEGENGIAVKLSRVETYDDIQPRRTEGVSAWISIMRGCDNFCTFCVVPFTRGRERSRPLNSIVSEVANLQKDGFKEVTLLGQNVNSYRDSGLDFPDLLASCAEAAPDLRIRYTTSHPKDMSDKLIETMADYENICKYIHLPVQSGSDRILEAMNRGYTAEHYLERIDKIRNLMPDCSLTTDIIAGFPTETDYEHKMTIDLMKKVRFDGAFMFKYSPRENTKAWKMPDDVPEEIKLERLNEIIELQQNIAAEINQTEIGNIHEVLAEGPSKKDPDQWFGRTDTNKITIFDNHDSAIKCGDKIHVKIRKSTSATLIGNRL